MNFEKDLNVLVARDTITILTQIHIHIQANKQGQKEQEHDECREDNTFVCWKQFFGAAEVIKDWAILSCDQ